jgi:hypothetical protein
MNALSLSKSRPEISQGNKVCARSMARTTSVPSRTSSGKHSVQPVATSTRVNVWMNEPVTDMPPCATRSASREARWWITPVVKGPDRHLATHRR